MGEVSSELLLTDYLLNFVEECASDGFEEEEARLSGVESNINNDVDEESCPLSSLKRSIKTKPETNTTGNSVKKQKNAPDRARKRSSLALRSREYRARKAQRIKATEEECKQLKESNKALNEKNTELGERVSTLEKQIEYLEKVLENETALAAVLGAVNKHSGVSFQKNPLQMLKKRKRIENVHDENAPQRSSNGGVCLHLTPGRMSLEFCRECDVNAGCDE